jgi:hypothetical protein
MGLRFVKFFHSNDDSKAGFLVCRFLKQRQIFERISQFKVCERYLDLVDMFRLTPKSTRWKEYYSRINACFPNLLSQELQDEIELSRF